MSRNVFGYFLLCVVTFAAWAQNTAPLSTLAPPQMPTPAAPQNFSVPAITLPQSVPDGTPAEGHQQEKTPTFEFTAVEALPAGAPAEADERLRPFRSMLDKLSPGGSFRVVNQEAKEAPFSSETRWSINERYDAFVLPMEQTQDGAVRLDARVAQLDAGKSLNALRAEGEVPSGKVMAFRGLQGPDGGELFLLLRQKNDEGDDQSGGDGDSGQQNDMESKSDEQSDQEMKDSEKSDAEKAELAKAEEHKDEQKAESDAPKDAQNLEALLQSLEEEDQRQQADARFDRRKIELPPSGEWW